MPTIKLTDSDHLETTMEVIEQPRSAACKSMILRRANGDDLDLRGRSPQLYYNEDGERLLTYV